MKTNKQTSLYLIRKLFQDEFQEQSHTKHNDFLHSRILLLFSLCLSLSLPFSKNLSQLPAMHNLLKMQINTNLFSLVARILLKYMCLTKVNKRKKMFELRLTLCLIVLILTTNHVVYLLAELGIVSLRVGESGRWRGRLLTSLQKYTANRYATTQNEVNKRRTGKKA